MITEITPVEPVYWIAHDGRGTVVHCGVADKGAAVVTGQPGFEQFATTESFAKRLAELIDLRNPETARKVLEDIAARAATAADVAARSPQAKPRS